MARARQGLACGLLALAFQGIGFVAPRGSRAAPPVFSAAAAVALPLGAQAQEEAEAGDPTGTLLTVLGAGVVLLGFGFVFWVFNLEPAKDASGKARASSLAGLENIDKVREQIENETEEEADEYMMQRGVGRKKPKDEEEEEFAFLPVEGALTTYCLLQEGAGDAVVENGDEVTVHATGLIRDTKTKFWSTKDVGQQPFTYKAGGGVIKGWDLGVRGMKKGETRGLRIPSIEGYRESGFPSWGIPPHADLLFEIEVLGIKRQGQTL
ncbi:unnamed protein product [Effrenium voratum]|uniref:peptidylprolyl isomerase n=1 Tax=Effrenium voratum TaxID=2562239 RepID=A0AA36ISN4_9DINO|nr:unnamed protein product [Effrenium voratum]